MDQEARRLAARLVERLQTVPPTSRLLVGLAGIPASGKSALAVRVVQHANALLLATGAADARAVLVGLDGWHLTRAQLAAMPDPQLAADRRGAHWTFDGAAYAACVRALRADVAPGGAPVLAPSFDHAAKDPAPGAVAVLPAHRIVLIEGLYAFLALEPWGAAARTLDERWFVDVDFAEAQRRLVARHVATGVATDRENAVWRAEENDMPNGRFIIEHMMEPTLRIQSITDPAFIAD